MKKNFLESRDEVWFLRNKRPAKLREQLKMLESMFQSNQVVTFFWKDLQHLKVNKNFCYITLYSLGIILN